MAAAAAAAAARARRAAPLLVLLAACVLLHTAGACQRQVVLSSPYVGAAASPAFVEYSHEQQWQDLGDITELSLLYGVKEGCVKGVRALYGADPANAHHIGLLSESLQQQSLQLAPGERVVAAEYTASTICIHSLALKTSHGRRLAAGQPGVHTAELLVPSQPGAYLAYLNGYTAKKMAGPNVGKLVQLQLVWAVSDCAAPGAGAAAATARPAAQADPAQPTPQQQPRRRGGLFGLRRTEGPPVRVRIANLDAQEATGDAAASPSAAAGGGGADAAAAAAAAAAARLRLASCDPGATCSAGMCGTSSCVLSGMGGEAAGLKACYGTNMRLPFLAGGAEVQPCTYLACKLIKDNCTSPGIQAPTAAPGASGGFCTGRVVALTPESMLHPEGRKWLGHPCLEVPGSPPSLVANVLQDIATSPRFVARAWKACDCAANVPTPEQALHMPVLAEDGSLRSFTPIKPSAPGGSSTWAAPAAASAPGQGGQGQAQAQAQAQAQGAFPLQPVYSMSSKDVVAQWLVAAAGGAALPHVTLPASVAAGLQQLIPGFSLPALVVSDASRPLLAAPKWMQHVPVHVLPAAALATLLGVLPELTSLPTLALPEGMTRERAATELALPPNMHVSHMMVATLPMLATTLGLPALLLPQSSRQAAPAAPAASSTNDTSAAASAAPKAGAPPAPAAKPEPSLLSVTLAQMNANGVLLQWAAGAQQQAPLPVVVLDEATRKALKSALPHLNTPAVLVPHLAEPLLRRPDDLFLTLVPVPERATAAVVSALPELTSLPTVVVTSAQAKLDLPKLKLQQFLSPEFKAFLAATTAAAAAPAPSPATAAAATGATPAASAAAAAPIFLAVQPAAAPASAKGAGGKGAALAAATVLPLLPPSWQGAAKSSPELAQLLADSVAADKLAVRQELSGEGDAAVALSGFRLPLINLGAVQDSEPASRALQKALGIDVDAIAAAQAARAAADAAAREALKTAQKHSQMSAALGAAKPLAGGAVVSAPSHARLGGNAASSVDDSRPHKMVGSIKPGDKPLLDVDQAVEAPPAAGAAAGAAPQQPAAGEGSKAAGSTEAATDAAVPQQQQPQQQQQAAAAPKQPAAQPAAKAGLAPGTEDDDGALVVSKAELQRALLPEGDWNALDATAQAALLNALTM